MFSNFYPSTGPSICATISYDSMPCVVSFVIYQMCTCVLLSWKKPFEFITAKQFLNGHNPLKRRSIWRNFFKFYAICHFYSIWRYLWRKRIAIGPAVCKSICFLDEIEIRRNNWAFNGVRVWARPFRTLKNAIFILRLISYASRAHIKFALPLMLLKLQRLHVSHWQ